MMFIGKDYSGSPIHQEDTINQNSMLKALPLTEPFKVLKVTSTDYSKHLDLLNSKKVNYRLHILLPILA